MYKRQQIIKALRASTVILFIVGFTILSLIIARTLGEFVIDDVIFDIFIFFVVFIFVSSFIDIVLGSFAAKITTWKQAIICAIFSFITINITAGIKFLKLNEEDLSQTIEYRKGQPYSNNKPLNGYQKPNSFASTDTVDKLRTLEQYRALYNNGLISEEEFEKKKEEILK